MKTQDEGRTRKHYIAVLQALFVTVLWSSSWVIIKFGLEEIPPLTFSGLRYSIAAILLLAVIVSRRELRDSVKGKSMRWWVTLAIYGIIFISITQGAQFVGLELLEAITVSMLLNLTPLLVLVFGIILLREVPTIRQIGWIILGIAGVLLYFYPVAFAGSQTLGLIIVGCGVLTNALSSILGRSINKQRTAPPVVITGVSMAIGSLFLLLAGFIFEGFVTLSMLSTFYILWLSVVNTAIAFTIWNKVMQTLRAIDISIINSTMLPQIVILSIVFLGEMPELMDWFGLVLVGLSALAVQVSQAKREVEDSETVSCH
ncbi:MAG: DMT family transporter [Candidatus Thorarchaeota archaeon]